jgi:undecaprenyl diphosphate synthase
MSIADIKKTTETKMAQSIEALKNNLGKIRTGRANPAILDAIVVDYYGNPTPLNQVANITLLDNRTISVQPWEKGLGAKVEKAIRDSDLGVNPVAMGDLIRVPMPAMSEERRKEMTKLVRNDGENSKIAIRNLRRDAIEGVKKLVKDKLASEDEQKRSDAETQKTTDKFISEVDKLVALSRHGIYLVSSYFDSKMTTPQHIAIVMDGNGRWARQRYLPRVAGHRQGVEALRRCVRYCAARGIQVLTVFAFSSENWNRPQEEVSGLMNLLITALSGEVKPLHESGVRICFVGDRSRVSDKVRAGFEQAEQLTQANQKITLNVCFNYGGRWDIAQAAQKIAARGHEITEEALGAEMATAHVSDPDLLIRTGGEYRISNFLLWQCAYSELYFSDKLWPDFDEAALDAAILAFTQRERRFGKTSEQVTQVALAA